MRYRGEKIAEIMAPAKIHSQKLLESFLRGFLNFLIFSYAYVLKTLK